MPEAKTKTSWSFRNLARFVTSTQTAQHTIIRYSRTSQSHSICSTGSQSPSHPQLLLNKEEDQRLATSKASGSSLHERCTRAVGALESLQPVFSLLFVTAAMLGPKTAVTHCFCCPCAVLLLQVQFSMPAATVSTDIVPEMPAEGVQELDDALAHVAHREYVSRQNILKQCVRHDLQSHHDVERAEEIREETSYCSWTPLWPYVSCAGTSTHKDGRTLRKGCD